jgi:hypothetical protein
MRSFVPQAGTSQSVERHGAPSTDFIHHITSYSVVSPNLICELFFTIYLQCVDEWLRVNATCPTCRKSILPTDGSRGQGGNAEQVNGNGNMINISHGDRPGQRLITLNFEIPGDARIT